MALGLDGTRLLACRDDRRLSLIQPLEHLLRVGVRVGLGLA
jgi:hypothetical protein